MTGLIAALAIVGTLHVVGISEAASVERPASSDHGTAGKSRLEVRPLDAGRSTLAADSTLPVVTLDDALRRAARLDPQYVQAQGNLDVAEWQRRAAYSALVLPSLNLSTDVTRYSTPNFNAGTFNQQLVAANAYATARYDVFTGGRKLAEASAARANVRRAEAGELEARYGSALRTETDYYQVLLDQELDRVARERVERAQEQLVVARARVTSGASVQTDSLQLRLEVNRARVELLRQDAAVRVSRLQLGRRVGFDGPVQAAPLDSAVPAELPVTLEQTITEARQRGPTYVAARESERAAEAGVRAQRGSYLPAVSVSATSAAFDDSFFPGQTTRTWGTLALNFPLWNGGQRELAVSQAAASRAVARATRLDAERAVERDVTERYERYGTARATVELSADAVVVARENYRVEQTRYKGGAGTILELLSAQDRLTQAEADLVRARYDARLALAGLESILGRRLFNDRNIP